MVEMNMADCVSRISMDYYNTWIRFIYKKFNNRVKYSVKKFTQNRSSYSNINQINNYLDINLIDLEEKIDNLNDEEIIFRKY